MKKETKDLLIMFTYAILGLIITISSILWGIGYMVDTAEQQILDNLRDNLILNNSYGIISISSNFISGNECNFFVSIILKNQTTEIILTDFIYDICEDKLYYGRYQNNYLDEQYGKIIN